MSQDAAVSAFEQRFRQKLSQDPELIEKLVGLRNKTLGCWCKPKSCHCDVLLKLADECSGVLHPPEPPRTSGVLHPPEEDDWDDDGDWLDGYDDDDGPLTNAGPMVRGNRGAAGSARGGGGGRRRVDGKGSVYSAKHVRKVAGQR